jgi:hypothetical protein
MSKKIPFFEYPRLWTDYKQEYISIIDRVASSGGYILQKELKLEPTNPLLLKRISEIADLKLNYSNIKTAPSIKFSQ